MKSKFLSISLVLCALLFVFIGSLLLFSPKDGYTQVLPNTAANRARGVVGCTQTSSGISCPRGGSSGGSSRRYSPKDAVIEGIFNGIMQGVQRARDEAHRRKQEAWNHANHFNEAGLSFSKRGKYKEAAEQYRLALKYWPGEATIAGNLRNAVRAEQKAEERRLRDIELEEWKQANQAIEGLLGDFASQWDGGSGSTLGAGMDFMSGTAGNDGRTLASVENPTVASPVGIELFSRGSKTSAPVATDGSRPWLALPEAPPDATVDPKRRPLLEGEALEVAKLEAKSAAAFRLGLDLAAARQFDAAIPYLREALARHPDCSLCREELAKAERLAADPQAWMANEVQQMPLDALAEAFPEAREARLAWMANEVQQMPFDDLAEAFPEAREDRQAWMREEVEQMTLDALAEAFPKAREDPLDEDRDGRSKADYILDALEYGNGSWEASSNYIEDVARAHPGDREARDAQMFIQGITTGILAAEDEE